MSAMSAHDEIEVAPVNRKPSVFYRHLAPLRKDFVSLLADSYRRYFKLALAHPRQTGRDPDHWASDQLQPDVGSVLEWIHNWYILACDGENQYVRHMGTTPLVPGQTVSLSIPTIIPPFPPPTSWRAPAWLFEISLALVGIGLLKEQHVPVRDSEERLGEAHTRLLLKGARRVFLWDLGAAIKRVRDEETAAAGAIRVEAVSGQRRGPNKRKGWEQRLKLYDVIQTVLSANPNLQGMKFCAELDKRHAQPLWDWMKSGEWQAGLTWKEAWGKTNLRRKIRRVRQEAQKGS
ncbi:MAG: hypothetical protein DMG49_19040 [Acidobacteria bacterium]|nr:MAG: hypothetical protein DMG49_19040 [Acidobacteriota bacterium]PYY12365.1 MAG: hypothetical protein DMG69_01435 [Acidobacteriota bacterium]